MFLIAASPIYAEQVVIKKGDTLWSLSRQYNTTVELIKKENNLVNNLIFPNDILEISPINNLTITKADTLKQPEKNSVQATKLVETVKTSSKRRNQS